MSSQQESRVKKGVPELLTAFLSEFSVEAKLEHAQQTVLKDRKSNKSFLMKQITIDEEFIYEQTMQALYQQIALSNDHLLSLLDFTATKNEWTGELELLLFYDHCKISLSNEIEVRREQGRCFKQEELWNMMLSVICGAAYLQQNEIGHGCISPDDIYISSAGVVKLSDPTLASSSPFTLQEGYYYSVQLMGFFQDGQLPQNFNIFKSDVFSLGMCMIQAALLVSSSDCYAYHEYAIALEPIQEKLQLIESYYSPELMKVIEWMIEIEIESRPDFLQLRKTVISLMAEQMLERELAISQGSGRPRLSLGQYNESAGSTYRLQESTIKQRGNSNPYCLTQSEQSICEFNFQQNQHPSTVRASDKKAGHIRTRSFNVNEQLKQKSECIKEENTFVCQKSNREKNELLKTAVDESNVKSNDQFDFKSDDQSRSRNFGYSKVSSQFTNKQNHPGTCQMYTDPDFLEMMRCDSQEILNRRKNTGRKSQLHFDKFTKRIL